MEKEKKAKPIFLKIFFRGAEFFFILFLVAFGMEFLEQKTSSEEVEDVAIYKKTGQDQVRVLAEEDEIAVEEKNQKFDGNKYAARDIIIGSETLMAMTDDEKTKEIALSHMKGKLYKTGEKENVTYVLSWKSNKPTSSTLRYKTDGGNEFEEIKEENYSTVHAMTLSELDYSSVYQYEVQSRDRWEAAQSSEQYVFYTGKPEASFIDILEEAFNDVFGWARFRS